MTLKTLLRLPRLLEDASTVITQQNHKISQLEHDLHRVHLDYNREMRGLVCGWLISLEKPEVELRHDLAELDAALANRVAELEEHVL